MMATRILEAKNIDVDTVTGATTTSMAVQSAVADAITNAGGNPKDFRLGAATPSGGAAQTADVDVAFMGAGTAGLVAATRLLEAGKTVVLFEKQDIAGGSMPMTYSGVAAAESQLQANYALGRADDNPMYNKQAMLAVMQKYLVPENDRFDGAMPYQTAMYSNSGQLGGLDARHRRGLLQLGREQGVRRDAVFGSRLLHGRLRIREGLPGRSHRCAWRTDRIRDEGDRTRAGCRRSRDRAQS